MWEDMNSHVRRIAGQTLGKCGCGQAVHEEMVSRLQSQHWQDRVEALRLLSYLGRCHLRFCLILELAGRSSPFRRVNREVHAAVLQVF